MSKIPRISGDDAVRAFAKLGFKKKRQVGSHAILKKEGHRHLLSVPMHKELAKGTLNKLVVLSGLEMDQFIELL